jgi:hypothetical protein
MPAPFKHSRQISDGSLRGWIPPRQHRTSRPSRVLQAGTQKLHRRASPARYLYAPSLLDPPSQMLDPATT